MRQVSPRFDGVLPTNRQRRDPRLRRRPSRRPGRAYAVGQPRDALLGGCELVTAAAAAGMEPGDLSPGALRPQLGAQLAEQRQRGLERGPGSGGLIRAALGGAEREQRARALEGLRDLLKHLEGGAVVGERVVVAVLGAGDHSLTAQGARNRPRAPQLVAERLEAGLGGA